jgi:hypothetical protein
MRSFASAPVTRAGSDEPLASMATPMLSIPSLPVVDTVATWSASLATAPPAPPVAAFSGVLASATSWTLRVATAASPAPKSGAALSTRTP